MTPDSLLKSSEEDLVVTEMKNMMMLGAPGLCAIVAAFYLLMYL